MCRDSILLVHLQYPLQQIEKVVAFKMALNVHSNRSRVLISAVQKYEAET
jgi:hypothetical protein